MKKHLAVGSVCLGMLFLACLSVSSVSAQEPDLEAFDFRAAVAQILPGQDVTASDQVLAGHYSWLFTLQNKSQQNVDNATIAVDGVAVPPVSSFAEVLAPEDSLRLNELENSDVPNSFTPGFSSARIVAPETVPPGQSIQTVSVLVAPDDGRYDYPNAHIAVRVEGNVLAIRNPDTTEGESLDIAEVDLGGAFWMIHRVKLNKTYLFEADLLIDNATVSYTLSKPGVEIGMTSHDEIVLPPITAFGALVVIPDSELGGQVIYSAESGDLNWVGKTQKDFVINYPSFQQPPPPEPTPARTIGYWKNHPEVIDRILLEKPINLGTGSPELFVHNRDDALAFLSGAKAKDATAMLAAQLLATILNLRNGADPFALGTDIRDTVGVAKQFLQEHSGVAVTGKHPDRDLALALKDALDAFNNSGE